MKRSLLIVAIIALYLLHQDFWFWRAARPVVFGFLPIGLFYHVCYTLAISALMWLLVRGAWPSHLEEEGEGVEEWGQGGEDQFAPSRHRPVARSLDVLDVKEGRRQ